MKTLQLKNDLYWAGILDKDLRVFDIIMYTEFGTTYNSYILKGSDATVLFETAKAKYFDEYIEAVKQVTPLEDIKYVVVSHTEPDHAGSIERLLDLNPKIKIVATAGAISFLKHIVNRDFYSIAVKENSTLSIGNKTLRFMVLPNLHWPDTMYTYIEEDNTLVTCDSFGSHYSHEGILRSTVTDVEGYMRATKYYFDNIIGPFKQPYMTRALDRIKDLKIDLICPGHGPVLDSNIEDLMKTYAQWCEIHNPNTKKTVVIPYVSAYGYTAMLAEKIADGIKSSGDVEVRIFDMVESDEGAVLGEIAFADGVLFGTPTILCEALKPIWNLVTSMFPQLNVGKLASAFGSYGWSGEGVPHIIERLKQLRMRVLDGYRVRFKPSENQLVEAFEFGYDFGCTLQGKENDRKVKDAGLVKCVICGEIFDAKLTSCPVCGVGPENFIPVDESEVTFKSDTNERFIILGAGAAALNAATSIRERNEKCSIVMISDEPVLPYNRPMLTKNMLAGLESDQFAIHDSEWYKANNIELVLGATISNLDTSLKTVTLKDGKAYQYDKCIYALGASSAVPPISGSDLPEVVTIRTLDDIKKVDSLLKSAKNAVVIGGGILGLESAWELSKSKCDVTVLEMADRLMPNKLDAGASEMLCKIAESNGIKVHTSVQIDKILGSGKVSGVKLKDGAEHAADLVILSCGVRPNIGIAKEAGLNINRAIVVDDEMHTGVSNVFACGDCAEFGGVNYALWSEATDMGKVAGANAAGDKLKYEYDLPAVTMNALNTSLYAIGDNGMDKTKSYKTVEIRDDKKHTLKKLYFLNNCLCGVILIGDTSELVKLSQAVEERTSFKDLEW